MMALQTTAELQDKIFALAQRARTSYQATADVISKLGLLAGDAFKSNDEMIAFSELMQKAFTVSGASIQEQTAAMYQLTQAMAAGRLQGDEFRSIMENAPMLVQAIEDYMHNVMGVEGTLKDMSAEGLITADVIKNAMFSAADDIENKFKEMPMTFGQIGTIVGNTLLQTFEPVIQGIGKGAQWIYDNWSTLEPIFKEANTGFSFDYDNMMNNIADIAGNTAKVADSMEISEESLEYMRDLAEQQAINRFTTAEINIEMNNENHINSELDLDGIVAHLEDKVYETMVIAAEGVHE
ncbi:tape measure protein [Thermoanaerobacterium sp. RBIITD]|uniref:tape measure protein n=1 Tax=Thermoanaerobacterium sp. RBIITD TaxID=1550240 RepID=UPI000BBF45F5|nr:tape measure protein [Thermoanaerobacterium sp. RBIITD]SNX53041.1 tape measure domain-containing protein [Thermoanaerobacterium sp. RBIITD]